LDPFHFSRFWLSLRDFVFPPVCVGCEKNETKKGLVCAKCLEQLNLNPLPSIPMPEWTGISHLRALGSVIGEGIVILK
jgi:predicted amidophosphoribosyltransferase